jgi:hypothetical protein
MHRLLCLVVIGAAAVVVGVVAAGPAAAAKGGNNDTAKVCQKGGWQNLVTDRGGKFANQGDCVNDGAQGSAPFGTAGKAACAEIGGSFRLTPAKLWTCFYTPNSTGSNTTALQNACAIDGGTFETEDDPPNEIAICFV